MTTRDQLRNALQHANVNPLHARAYANIIMSAREAAAHQRACHWLDLALAEGALK